MILSSSSKGWLYEETSCKFIEGVMHASRIHYAFLQDAGIPYAEWELDRLTEERSCVFDRTVWREIVRRIDGRKVLLTAFGVDERPDFSETRFKCWAAVGDPTPELHDWARAQFDAPEYLPERNPRYLLMGCDLYPTGKTRYKPYLTYSRDIAKLLPRFDALDSRVFEYLSKAPSMHVAVSPSGKLGFHVALPPPAWLHNEQLDEIVARHKERGSKPKLFAMTLDDARTGDIRSFNVYFNTNKNT